MIQYQFDILEFKYTREYNEKQLPDEVFEALMSINLYHNSSMRGLVFINHICRITFKGVKDNYTRVEIEEL
jgi:hypothetical protein